MLIRRVRDHMDPRAAVRANECHDGDRRQHGRALHAARTCSFGDSGEGVEKLLDIADRMYVRHDCGDLNPYDLVLPHLGSSALCVEHAVRRRLYFFAV
jgi:hypothetical protein